MTYRVGIDAGSKTLKVVVLDEEGNIIYSSYKRHRAEIKKTLHDALHDLSWQKGNIEATFAITGSAGIEIATELGIPFVQEVVATTQAVRDSFPQADAIIELGGEDAKVVYLTGGLEQRMNATCAGGTGGFIDNIAFMLGVRASQFDRLAMGATQSYPIASRCAVFAQTDVRPLLNAGIAKADIAASVYDAVVRQTLSGLACGRAIKGTVVFLGGPLEYMANLTNRFRKELGLSHETGIKPANAHLFTARGAALLSQRENTNKPQLIEDLIFALDQIGALPDDLGELEPLFTSQAEIEEFRQKHSGCAMEQAKLSNTRGPLYLGVDAGSTSIKLAVLDQEKRLVYHDYQLVGGDVVHTLRDMLKNFYISVPHPYGVPDDPYAWVSHATATGYGEELLKAAFGVDTGVVETTAHLRAALHLCPDATFVFDIGGQDMKAIWIKDGQVIDSVLNEACSSGCGAFIEGTAHSLHSNKFRFADVAFLSEHPVDLGTKCTVFMSSRVKHAQKIGVSTQDIAAGAAYSVVRNALYRIIGADRAATMGDHIVVQGGTFMSDAVLRAFEKISGAQVVRPKQADLMGAIGAALVAFERANNNAEVSSPASNYARSNLIGARELNTLEPKRRVAKCPGCGNACSLAIVSFGNDRVYVTGNKCGVGEVEGAKLAGCTNAVTGETFHLQSQNFAGEDTSAQIINVVALERKLLNNYKDVLQDLPRGSVHIGLMNTLNMRTYTPFWHTLLYELGFSVVVPDMGTELFETSQAWESVPSESVCYPAKVSHARHFNLVEKGADAILMVQFERGNSCPVSSNYAQVLVDNTDQDVPVLAPLLTHFNPEKIVQNETDLAALLASLNDAITNCGRTESGAQKCSNGGLDANPHESVAPVTMDELQRALAAALKAQSAHENTVTQANTKALEWVHADSNRHALLIAGRPYHADDAIIHGIDNELEKLGFAVLSMTGLSSAALPSIPKLPNAWKQGKHAMRAAAYVAQDTQIDVVYLQSFDCLYDAMSIEDAHEFLDANDKQFIALKIDDINNIVHTRIRLRTLAEAIESKSRRRAS